MGALDDYLSLLLHAVGQFIISALTIVLSPLIFLYERITSGSNRKEFRSIFITGGNSGLGESLALAFAKPGVRLVLTARNKDRLESVAAECRKLGARVEAVSVDVTDVKEMARILLEQDEKDHFDLVIANAGVASSTLGIKNLEDNIYPTYDINVTGVWNTIFPILDRMRARKHGQIAIMSSLAGFGVLPPAPEYCSSKHAVRIFGEALRPVLAVDHVGLTVICPGYVRSRITCGEELKKPLFSMPGFMDAEPAAQIMKDGLERNVGVVIFPLSMSLATQLLATLPHVVRAVLIRLMVTKKLPNRILRSTAEGQPEEKKKKK